MKKQIRNIINIQLIIVMAICSLNSQFIQAQDKSYDPIPVYSVLDYGVINDGITMNTEKIQQLIDKVADEGGGKVYFPPGKYLTGTIYLKSYITLHIESGAVILGSLDLDDFEAVEEERLNHSARQQRHLIYGKDLVGVAISGRGMIDGRGYEFWPKDFRTMTEIEIRAAMTAPDGFSKRPGTYVKLEGCTDVLIENIQFKDSPHHMLKVLGSNDVKIQGISIEQGIYEDDGPNTDGLAVSGFNIRISDCNFTTGDDCLVIGGAEHLSLSNCTFSTTESAIVLSGLKNGTISNCSIFDAGGAINIRPGRGGLVENVTISNINYLLRHSSGGNLVFARSKPNEELRWSVKSWAQKWNVDMKPKSGPPPLIRNILISDVIANSDGAIFLDGQEDGYIEDITFDNIRYTMRGGREKPESANPSHPFYIFGHHTAPYGIFCRYVKDITLRNIKFTWNQPEKAEWGSAVRFENANNIEIDGFEGRQSLGSDESVIKLSNVNCAFVHDSQAAEGAGTFLKVVDGSKEILFMNNDLRKSSKSIYLSDDMDKNGVIETNNIK
jgi:hypothetical protein